MVIVLILEILLYGAVLNFSNPEGEPWRKTFSYFSMTPFGYANFGPFITAILSCVMSVLLLVYLLKQTPKCLVVCKVLSVIATVTSLMPLMFGLSAFSIVGVMIFLLLVAEYFILAKLK